MQQSLAIFLCMSRQAGPRSILSSLYSLQKKYNQYLVVEQVQCAYRHQQYSNAHNSCSSILKNLGKSAWVMCIGILMEMLWRHCPYLYNNIIAKNLIDLWDYTLIHLFFTRWIPGWPLWSLLHCCMHPFAAYRLVWHSLVY